MTTILSEPPRLAAEINGVAKLTIREVATELFERVGLRLLALIGSVKETRIARNWTDGTVPQKQDALRAALQAVRAIALRYDDATACAWLTSTNVDLGFRAPIVALRDAKSLEDFDRVVVVAVQDLE